MVADSGARVAGVLRLMGAATEKLAAAGAGEVVVNATAYLLGMGQGVPEPAQERLRRVKSGA